MDTFEVGKQLVQLFKAGKIVEAVESLYADDVVNVEAFSMPGKGQETRGKAKVLQQNQWWVEHHQVHGMTVGGPWPHEDRFIVHYDLDVTANAGPMAGKRFKMEEAALYTVKNGKIVKEEFFYPMCKGEGA